MYSSERRRRRRGRSSMINWRVLLNPSEHVRRAPAILQPYLRLIRYDRPAGTLTIWLPAMWSLCLATPNYLSLDPQLIAIFTAGSFFMRAAGCIINDLWDKEYDKLVERTQHRPLCNGDLTEYQAFGCLAVCLGASAALLTQLNEYSLILGASCLIPVTLYPLLKRYTYYPSIGLGLTLNWGVLVANSAVNGACDWDVALPLYLGSVFWTMYYDTVYAHQDKEDDLRIGVKSMALRFAGKSQLWLSIFAGGSVFGWSIAGACADQTLPYFVGITIMACNYINQLRLFDGDDRDKCGDMFRLQIYLGSLVLVGCLVARLFKPANDDIDETKTVDEYVYRYIMDQLTSAVLGAYKFVAGKIVTRKTVEEAGVDPVPIINSKVSVESVGQLDTSDKSEHGWACDDTHSDIDLPVETPEYCEDISIEQSIVIKNEEAVIDTRSPSPMTVEFQISEKIATDEIVDLSKRLRH